MHGNLSDSFLAWTKVCDMGDREMPADNYITRLSQLTMVLQLKRKATNRKTVDGKFLSVTLPSAFRFSKAKGANDLTYQCLTNERPVFLIFLLFLCHFLSFPPSSLVLFMFSNTGNLFFFLSVLNQSRVHLRSSIDWILARCTIFTSDRNFDRFFVLQTIGITAFDRVCHAYGS